MITEFFSTIPDMIRELWTFGRGWSGLAVTVGSIVLTAVLLAGAQRTRDEHGWVAATLGGMAAMITTLWAFGILPSAWIYFLDGAKDTLTDQVIPSKITLPWNSDWVIFGNFYEVFRDSVVMIETIVAMAGFAAVALWVQKRYPRTLADGEEARPQAGGYK